MTVVVLAHEMPDEYHIFLQSEFQGGFIFSEYKTTTIIAGPPTPKQLNSDKYYYWRVKSTN